MLHSVCFSEYGINLTPAIKESLFIIFFKAYIWIKYDFEI